MREQDEDEDEDDYDDDGQALIERIDRHELYGDEDDEDDDDDDGGSGFDRRVPEFQKLMLLNHFLGIADQPP